jgi:6,7-dimethyl-8-ribityllumazine synthase
MLTSNPDSPLPSGEGLRFAVVASRYNEKYVEGLLEAALMTLRGAGSAKPEVWRVPGAWEIPVVAAVLARRERGRPDAILCFGVIWQGETLHAQHIGDAVSDALMRLSVETGVPVIHQVLTVSSEAQATARCLDPATNRGVEGARTAVEMARLLREG